MTQIVDGKALRDKILQELKTKVESLTPKPKLAIILVGEDSASLRYIQQKQKAAEQIGAAAELVQLPIEITQEELLSKIKLLNQDPDVTGIIVQLPLPEGLDKAAILNSISPNKDVDGLVAGSSFTPATPAGIMQILEEYQVQIQGKKAVVLGRSQLVGAPVKQLLEGSGAEVIQIHSQTPKPIDALVQHGDIVVSAVGQPGLVTADMIKPGAVVIDVGTSVNSEGKLIGDVVFDKVSQKASLITPVPGGVGPMTVAMLMKNLVLASSIDK